MNFKNFQQNVIKTCSLTDMVQISRGAYEYVASQVAKIMNHKNSKS